MGSGVGQPLDQLPQLPLHLLLRRHRVRLSSRSRQLGFRTSATWSPRRPLGAWQGAGGLYRPSGTTPSYYPFWRYGRGHGPAGPSPHGRAPGYHRLGRRLDPQTSWPDPGPTVSLLRRLDLEMVRRGMVASRSEAALAIESGKVSVGDRAKIKASTLVRPDEPILRSSPARRFASRGGDKLDAALDG